MRRARLRFLLPALGLALGASLLVPQAFSRAERGHATPGRETGPLYGVQHLAGIGFDTWQLARIDPRTLRPLGRRRLDVGAAPYVWSVSPSRSKVAIAFRIVDLRRIRMLGRIRGGSDEAWVAPKRLLAVAENGATTFRDIRLRLITSDPISRHVLGRASLPGWPPFGERLAVASTRHGLALLLWSSADRVAPVELAVGSADGAVRAVRLDRILAGPGFGESGAPGSGLPALAVDRAHGRAFVLDGGLAAQVDLGTLQVQYHKLSQPVSLFGRLHDVLEPRAAAKESDGSYRFASWVGGGLIAVAGYDFTTSVDPEGVFHWQRAPAGLKLVDTRDWNVRTLDRLSSAFELSGTLVLGYGVELHSPGQSTPGGSGLRIYGSDGALRAHLFGQQPLPSVGVFGRFAYPMAWPRAYGDVVDLATGRIRRGYSPWSPLVGNGP